MQIVDEKLYGEVNWFDRRLVAQTKHFEIASLDVSYHTDKHWYTPFCLYRPYDKALKVIQKRLAAYAKMQEKLAEINEDLKAQEEAEEEAEKEIS